MMSVVRLGAPVERDGERALQLRWEGENFAVFVRACAFVICQHSSHVYEDIVSVHLLPVGVNVHEVIIYRGYQHHSTPLQEHSVTS